MSKIWNRRGSAGGRFRRQRGGAPRPDGAIDTSTQPLREGEAGESGEVGGVPQGFAPPPMPSIEQLDALAAPGHVAAQPPTDRVATVVYVCDDPSIAHPVCDAAARRSAEWDLHVVDDAEAALALTAELPSVDVFAAHAHGSERPVAELLDQVRRISPKTARVAISGMDDRDLLLRLIGVAHQYLAMPADIDQLTDLVEHVRSAAATKLRDPVRALVGQVDRLPSPPAMFERLAEIMASDEWSIDDLAAEIARDVALTGEILKLVNSAFYGAAQRVTTVNRAISLLGVDLTRFIVLGNKMFEPTNDLETWIDLNRLAHRSNAVAAGARALAIRDRIYVDASAVAYLAGVVSEIGLLVLGRVPDIDPGIATPINDTTHLGAERAIFGGDRFEVGSHLLTLWGFDPQVVDAVRLLSTDQLPTPGELPWYLVASRRLVVDEGLDPHELASRPGIKADVDEALDRLYDEVGFETGGDALIIASRR